MREVHYRVEAVHGKHSAVRYTSTRLTYTHVNRTILGRFDDPEEAAEFCRFAAMRLATRCIGRGTSCRIVRDLNAHDSSLNS
jgi:hypothetical protein